MPTMDELWFPEIAKGVLAGRMDAIEKARQTGTKLAIWWEGKVREVTADEMDEINRQAKVDPSSCP